MQGIIFDIEGKFAHFRKFYTNSSSLSYSIPPRTVLQGMLAAMFGLPRDSYYRKWNSDHLHIAVRKNGPTYSVTQTLNYIKAVSMGELRKPKEHTQIPFELIVAVKKVSYRLYVSFENEAETAELCERVRQERFVYPPVLGAAPFQADVTYVANAQFVKVEPEDFISVSTVLPVEIVKNIKVEEFALLKEKMPQDFGEDRKLLPARSYLLENQGLPLKVQLRPASCCYSVQYKENEEYITFL
ncbi:CRISPR-associated protein Cas5 [Propionispora vibrioides]|uniref:CRISPR-associated protein, Cas5h family n=1 Tax=Propionispora vibrioides TaxID=112903 RepID=A0A1H8UPE5_9FIRM|nr:CRISPR-associated protein Cas5 [Propionispora vibrioides]SEP04843.1 CRISPR-associated protein, Cas5h family [Propionispora vibrioides]